MLVVDPCTGLALELESGTVTSHKRNYPAFIVRKHGIRGNFPETGRGTDCLGRCHFAVGPRLEELGAVHVSDSSQI